MTRHPSSDLSRVVGSSRHAGESLSRMRSGSGTRGRVRFAPINSCATPI